MMKKVIIILLVAVIYYKWSEDSSIGLQAPLAFAGTAGLSLQQAPRQQALEPAVTAFRFDDYTIRPLATFQAHARVLARRHYRSGREADLSPVDLALGWGPMADDAVLAQIDISQSGRFYFWRVAQFPIPRRAIETHSANMHMIPASPEVEQQLRAIEAGDVIRFSGYLVRVEADDGWRWQSSLSRDDTGAGACELILVQAVDHSSTAH